MGTKPLEKKIQARGGWLITSLEGPSMGLDYGHSSLRFQRKDKGSLRLSFLQLRSIMRDLTEQYQSIELRSGCGLKLEGPTLG